jgi:DNA polymerase III gamma/tau subunit
MQRSFARVIKGEGKKVSSEALEYLSKAVDGSFRDGVKILDQVLSNADSVELSDIELVVSGSSNYKVTILVNALASRDVKESLKQLSEATSNGVDMSYLIVSIMRGLRDKLLNSEVEIEVSKFIFALDEVARRLATSLDGELLIQVAIVEWCGHTESNSQIINSLPAQAGPILKSKLQSSDLSPKIAQRSELESQMQKEEEKSPWQIMKEKLKSGEKISPPKPKANEVQDDTIDDAMAIFTS